MQTNETPQAGKVTPNKPQVLHFSPAHEPIDAIALIAAIRGVFRTLDQADFASADWNESDRLSQLVSAGDILSQLLETMATEPDSRRRRAAPLAVLEGGAA